MSGSVRHTTPDRKHQETNRGPLAPEFGKADFPRSSRLLESVEFKRVFKKNVVSADRYFKVLGRPNNESLSRLGMAVSRQVDRKAVGRNRIKRVIRESFRHFYGGVTGIPLPGRHKSGDERDPWHDDHFIPVDLVVLPRPVSATICNRQLFLSLQTHWSRINRQLEQNREGEGLNKPGPDRSGRNRTQEKTNHGKP